MCIIHRAAENVSTIQSVITMFKNCILIKDVRVKIDIFYTANFVAMQ